MRRSRWCFRRTSDEYGPRPDDGGDGDGDAIGDGGEGGSLPICAPAAESDVDELEGLAIHS